MTDNVVIYLSKQKSAASGENADHWHKLEELYAKKLWHPLTKLTRDLIESPSFSGNLNLKDFYDNFINNFEHRINTLQLAEITVPVARFIAEKNPDRTAAYEFLAKIEKTVSKDKLAVARVHTGEIELRLHHKDANDVLVDIPKIRQLIESTQKEVDVLVGVTEVHAPFYKVSALYLKEIRDFAGYYREALRYLGVEDSNRMASDAKYIQALTIGFAALLGENVYNFGELLAHLILKSLENSGEKWLIEMLDAFNCGDLNKFYKLEKHWTDWDDIKKEKDSLVEKIRLMAVMEIALARPSKERSVTFSELAAKCQVNTDDIELLVMKALSKDLVRGYIDQVNQTVQFTRVQPRVLNMTQISNMACRVAAWSADVTSMEHVISENAHEMLVKK